MLSLPAGRVQGGNEAQSERRRLLLVTDWESVEKLVHEDASVQAWSLESHRLVELPDPYVAYRVWGDTNITGCARRQRRKHPLGNGERFRGKRSRTHESSVDAPGCRSP